MERNGPEKQVWSAGSLIGPRSSAEQGNLSLRGVGQIGRSSGVRRSRGLIRSGGTTGRDRPRRGYLVAQDSFDDAGGIDETYDLQGAAATAADQWSAVGAVAADAEPLSHAAFGGKMYDWRNSMGQSSRDV